MKGRVIRVAMSALIVSTVAVMIGLRVFGPYHDAQGNFADLNRAIILVVPTAVLDLLIITAFVLWFRGKVKVWDVGDLLLKITAVVIVAVAIIVFFFFTCLVVT